MKKPTSFSKFILIMAIPVILVLLTVIIIDPFFHYHKPLPGLSYYLSDERYQNDGIVRHFEYDAIISGSSEAQNIRATDINRLFNVNSIKTCFAGGTFNEVNRIITTAVSSNPNIKYVFRSFDTSLVNYDKDEDAYKDTPGYLYDKNPFNDYKYIFNKEVILKGAYALARSFAKVPPTSFDEYSSFYHLHEFGKEATLRTYVRPDITGEHYELSDIDKKRITENVEKNVVSLAKEHPEIEFYYFIPPYSVCVYDAAKRIGQVDQIVDTEILSYELVMNCPNIKVFSFNDITEISTDLNNYMDSLHYGENILQFIINSMAEGKYLLTKDNYLERFEFEREFYNNFDYDAVFGE